MGGIDDYCTCHYLSDQRKKFRVWFRYKMKDSGLSNERMHCLSHIEAPLIERPSTSKGTHPHFTGCQRAKRKRSVKTAYVRPACFIPLTDSQKNDLEVLFAVLTHIEERLSEEISSSKPLPAHSSIFITLKPTSAASSLMARRHLKVSAA